jgi:hypothetical protein
VRRGCFAAVGPGVKEDAPAFDPYRERRKIVGEGVEGTTARELEAGVMPVTGDDAIGDAAAAHGEAHVRTSIVDGEDVAVAPEQGNGVAARADDTHLLLAQLFDRAGVNLHGPRVRAHCRPST